MTSQPQHSRLTLNKRLSEATSALALLCVLTMLATTAAQTQTFTVLHTFTGMADGSAPYAGLTADGRGNFYGTTSAGGVSGKGVVFKLTHRGNGWTLIPLYNFSGPMDGAEPESQVVLGSDGSLYGTTVGGGGTSCSFGEGCGTVFKLTPAPTPCKSAVCPWIETVLYRFAGGSDGEYPGPVVLDQADNLYGTTGAGGAASFGEVFQLTRSGSSWMKTALYSFAGPPDGEDPASGVIFDHSGNLYGTATFGGQYHCGVVFGLTPSSSGWTENLLYTFHNSSDGCAPSAGLVFDPTGDLYGTTTSGNNSGTVFELKPSGGSWAYQLIYVFPGNGSQADPSGTLALDAASNIYGTTWQGDGGGCAMGQGCGNVFKLTSSSNGWTYSSLHDFQESDGGKPGGGVILDSAGNMYGTTWEGGDQQCQGGDYYGCGVIFEITP